MIRTLICMFRTQAMSVLASCLLFFFPYYALLVYQGDPPRLAFQTVSGMVALPFGIVCLGVGMVIIVRAWNRARTG